MENLVAAGHAREVVLPRGLEIVRHHCFHGADHPRVHGRDGPGAGSALVDDARVAQVVEPSARHRRNIGRAGRGHFERILAGEPAQRLAHRHVACAAHLGDGRDGELLAGVEPPAHQGLAEPLVDTVLDGLPGGDGREIETTRRGAGRLHGRRLSLADQGLILRVEQVAKPIAENVHRDKQNDQRHTGDHGNPPLPRKQVTVADLDERPERWLGRRHAEAEEGQRRFRHDGEGDVERRENEDRVQHVGQKLRCHDKSLSVPDKLGRGHIVLLLLHQHRAADETGEMRPMGNPSARMTIGIASAARLSLDISDWLMPPISSATSIAGKVN